MITNDSSNTVSGYFDLVGSRTVHGYVSLEKNSSEERKQYPPAGDIQNVSLGFPEAKPENVVQVMVERIIATLAFLFFLPLMLLIGLYIKILSKGPAVFRQDRVGRGGKTFKFVKFRTMYIDARERYPELYAYKYDPEDLTSFHFKVANDPRVVKGCMWLRTSTLDELPNFWNVITGSMALTGPRPEIPEMLQYYKGEMLEKFSVRPGITGLAQASGRGNLNFYESVACDLENVRRQSPWFSVQLLWKTLWKVITREGAF